MPKKNRPYLKKLFYALGIKMRYLHCMFACLALVNVTAMRLCLDLLLKEKYLIKPSKTGLTQNRFYIFRQRSDAASRYFFSTHCHDIGIDNWIQQWTWIAFYVGYVMTHVFGDKLVKRYGSKRVLSCSILCCMNCSLLTLLALKYKRVDALLTLRFIVGMCEGPIFSALTVFLTNWIPKGEKGKLGVFAFSGTQIGSFLIQWLWCKYLNKIHYCWAFYLCVTSAIVWIIVFNFFCSNKPEYCGIISDEEKRYIRKKRNNSKRLAGTTLPSWQELLTSPTTWSLILASVQHDWNEISSNISRQEQSTGKDKNRKNAAKQNLHQELGPTPFGSQTKSGKNQVCKKKISHQVTQRLSRNLEANPSPPNHSSQPSQQSVAQFLDDDKILLNLMTWIISISAGILSDFLINNGILDGTKTRQLTSGISALSPHLVDKLISIFFDSKPNSTSQKLIQSSITVLGTYYAGIKDTSKPPIKSSKPQRPSTSTSAATPKEQILSILSWYNSNIDGLLLTVTDGMGSLISSIVPLFTNLDFNNITFNDFGTFVWFICSVLIPGEMRLQIQLPEITIQST